MDSSTASNDGSPLTNQKQRVGERTVEKAVFIELVPSAHKTKFKILLFTLKKPLSVHV